MAKIKLAEDNDTKLLLRLLHFRGDKLKSFSLPSTSRKPA